jgi:putative transposase
VETRTRDVLRQIALEHNIGITTGEGIDNDQIFIVVACKPTQDIGKIVQWLKGISSQMLLSEFPNLKKQFRDRHLRATGYLAVSS